MFGLCNHFVNTRTDGHNENTQGALSDRYLPISTGKNRIKFMNFREKAQAWAVNSNNAFMYTVMASSNL